MVAKHIYLHLVTTFCGFKIAFSLKPNKNPKFIFAFSSLFNSASDNVNQVVYLKTKEIQCY